MKKKIYILIIILLLVLAGVLLFLILSKPEEKKKVKVSDALKFSKEYTEVSKDNDYEYRTSEEILKIMKNGTGVVYLGFPECPWCQTYVKYLDEVAKEVGIEKIYYYNVLEDRTNNTEDYKEMLKVLGDNLQTDDEGNPRVFVPNVSFHIDGEVIGNDCETSKDTKGFKKPEEYWNDDEVKDLKEKLTGYMKKVKSSSNMCTDCNK